MLQQTNFIVLLEKYYKFKGDISLYYIVGVSKKYTGKKLKPSSLVDFEHPVYFKYNIRLI